MCNKLYRNIGIYNIYFFDLVVFNNSLGGLSFGTDGEGNYGYFGADGSLIPFKSGATVYTISTNNILIGGSNSTPININISSIVPHYTTLTVNNFYLSFPSSAKIRNSGDISFSKSYDASTGIFKVTGGTSEGYTYLNGTTIFVIV